MSKYSLKEYYKKILKEDVQPTFDFYDEEGNVDTVKSTDVKDDLNSIQSFTFQEIEKIADEIRKDSSINTLIDNATISLDIPGEGEFFNGIKRDVKFENFLMLLFIAKESDEFDFSRILSINNEKISTTGIESLVASRSIKGSMLSESSNSTSRNLLLSTADMKSIESKVVDAKSHKDFKEHFINYMIISCSLAKTKDVQDLYTSSYSKRSSFISEIKKDFKSYFNIIMLNNLNKMAADQEFNSFFTSQGKIIGCLFEDILSRQYNGILNTKSNKKKIIALLFCQVLLGTINGSEFDKRFTGTPLQNTDVNASYIKDFETFFLSQILNKDKVDVFKTNIEKLNDFTLPTQIADIDLVLNMSNACFDFLVAESNTFSNNSSPDIDSKVAVFDLKSSHEKSSGAESSKIPTGSNENNIAVNELIKLSNIEEQNVTGSDFNPIASSKYKSVAKKNYIINSITLVKAVWKINQSGFSIEKIKATSSSLEDTTKSNKNFDQLKFKVPSDTFVNDIDMTVQIDQTDIQKFKNNIKNKSNVIHKDQKSVVKKTKSFIPDLENSLDSYIDFNNLSSPLKANNHNGLKKLFKKYFSCTQEEIKEYNKNNNSNTLNPRNFKDSTKLKIAKYIISLNDAGKARSIYNSLSPNNDNALRTIRAQAVYALHEMISNHESSSHLNAIKNKINALINKKLRLSAWNGHAQPKDFEEVKNQIGTAIRIAKSKEQSKEQAKQFELIKNRKIKRQAATNKLKGLKVKSNAYGRETNNDLPYSSPTFLNHPRSPMKAYSSGRKLDFSHAIKSGKILQEVYSYLYEGGLGGHMRHPYENLDVTPREMMDRIKSYGVPQTVIDKVDGQNLFFTVDRDGTLLFARNKQDMSHQDLVNKFTGHGAEAAFLEGGEAIKRGVEQWLGSAGNFADQEVLDIFHPTEDIRSFINFEIMHPKNSNQIQYDKKYIVFHSIVDFGEGRSKIFSSNQDDRLKKLISLMNAGVSSTGFELASNREIDLNTLSNVQIMVYTDRVRELIEALDMKEDEFLADGILRIIDEELSQEGVNLEENTLKIMRDFVLYGEDGAGDAITSRDFTKHISKEDTKTLRALGLTSATKAKAKVAKILSPFKEIFVDLGIDLLKGVDSAYLSPEQSKENITGLRDKLQTAIEDYDQYIMSTPEDELSKIALRLKPHVDKIKQVGIDKAVSTSVEGGVYTQDLDLEKITGGFAPLNQIVGAAYRDKEGIFPNLQDKFSMNENKRYSLKRVFSLDD